MINASNRKTERIFYHGTDKKNLESIRKKGLLSVDPNGKFDSEKGVVSLTPDKYYASEFALQSQNSQQSNNHPILIKISIPDATL